MPLRKENFDLTDGVDIADEIGITPQAVSISLNSSVRWLWRISVADDEDFKNRCKSVMHLRFKNGSYVELKKKGIV